MSRTYKALLRGDRIEWVGRPPIPERPIAVHITLLEDEAVDPNSGHEMARALEALADAGGLSKITDPVTWQREQRRNQALLGREP